MASSPLEAGKTMDALMALDAVHVLGNHDRNYGENKLMTEYERSEAFKKSH